MGIDPKTLPGMVVDDDQAKLTGKWGIGGGLEHVGKRYLYASPKARASARLEFTVPKTAATTKCASPARATKTAPTTRP